MMKWIRERNAEFEEFQRHSDVRTREDFIRLMAQLDRSAPQLIGSLAEELTAGESAGLEALQALARERTACHIDTDMLLTMACVWALEKSPQLITWLKVRRIAHHSWQIEHWLSEAISARIQNDKGARQAFTDLAVRLFNALEGRELRSESEHKNKARDGAWSYWQHAEYPLEELWWGLRGSDFMNYEEEMRIFGILSDIAPGDFQQLIVGSENPFLVDAALLSAGVGAFSPRFARWVEYVKAAPLAFTEDGAWTGSVVLPLLLLHAHNELLDPGRQVPRYGADKVEIAALADNVRELVRAVVDVLASREDAPATFARWCTWLMRQLLRQKEQDFSDIRTAGFVENALLEAIGKSMQGRLLIQETPEDAAPWESWSYRCVLSSFSHNGFAALPSFDEFASQWQLTPENWHGPKGRALLERARLHLPGDDIPGLSAHLLVYPLASERGFAAGWQQLWDGACYLREVAEFGAPGAGKKSYSDQADASGLLLLLACMGLACFDQAAARLETSSEQLSEEMASLHEVLATATMDMLYLDNTLNRDKWKVLLQHLALRRVFWDDSFSAGQRVAVFNAQQVPSIGEYLDYFRAEPGELVAFLHACMHHNLNESALREELKVANIDLNASVDILRRLNSLRGHRYPIDSRAVNAIAPLMG